jgi:hypothetical protein
MTDKNKPGSIPDAFTITNSDVTGTDNANKHDSHIANTENNDTVSGTDKPKDNRQKGWDNLIPQNKRTEEEQRAIASQGGKASGEARRKKKELKERCKILLELMPNKALIEKSLGEDISLPEGTDMYDLMIAKMMQVTVLDGNVKAFEAVRDSAGDKPTDKIVQDVAVMTDKDKALMEIVAARMSAGDGQGKDR